jgi:NitT/TauT family transport system substrate-binding protein
MAACRPKSVAPSVLRIAVLPILDTLPLYVAQRERYFEAEGIRVEFVAAGSAAERDQLLQAGQVDGVISDLVALALANREGIRLVAVRYAMTATLQDPQFRILASASSGLSTPGDLRGVPIGVSQGTVIEYVTDRLLQAEGLVPDDIRAVGVPRIPDRMALLASGELEAATLPEPLASLALQQGARLILVDSLHPELSCSIYAFRSDVARTRSEDVRRFLRAVDRASTTINLDRSRWDDLLSEQSLVPAPLIGSYTLPLYPEQGVPTELQYSDVIAWLAESELLDSAASYDQVVTAAYLE